MWKLLRNCEGKDSTHIWMRKPNRCLKDFSRTLNILHDCLARNLVPNLSGRDRVFRTKLVHVFKPLERIGTMDSAACIDVQRYCPACRLMRCLKLNETDWADTTSPCISFTDLNMEQMKLLSFRVVLRLSRPYRCWPWTPSSSGSHPNLYL